LFLLFLAPFFPEASKSERMLSGMGPRLSGGAVKAEDAKLPGAGSSPKPSYIRECQEKYLPLGSVPTDFSLGIQPD
jgi:hypothetical protein